DGGDAAFGNVDVGFADGESVHHIGQGPLFTHGTIKDLVVSVADSLLDPLQGDFEEVISPFRIPDLTEVAGLGVGQSVDGGGAGGVGCAQLRPVLRMVTPFALMINDPVAGDAQ